MSLGIKSEIDPLRLVIIHKPGIEHEYITPSNLNQSIKTPDGLKDNPDYLLFDDIINVSRAKNEHNEILIWNFECDSVDNDGIVV